MTVQNYPKLGECCHCATLDNGLPIYLFPKPDFGKCFAFFATNYGGIDTKFQLDGQWHTTPAGVAHFLEHKMFDTKEGNALQDLARYGASPNAFTSAAITGYYFESTQNFMENLEILLSFVSQPWFTHQSVTKEQGIIGQEIAMIEDNPEWRVFMNMLQGLYPHHPIAQSVAGTVDSIAQITADTLYTCHRAFYSPSNMVLCVAGNVSPEEVVALAEGILPKERVLCHRDDDQVPSGGAVRGEITQEMDVATTLFQLAFRAPSETDNPLRDKLLGELVSEIVLGTSTPLYAQLYEQGLVNKSYAYGYERYRDCAFLAVGGESEHPEKVRQAVLERCAQLVQNGIDPALWARIEGAYYGVQVRALDSFEHLCIAQAKCHFDGVDYLTFPQLFATITPDQVIQSVAQWMTAEGCTLSVVRPKKGAQP